MTITRKWVLALCLASWYSLSSSQTSLNMGDDGYSAVNLGFSFPYYDKTFNQAYMYDNGVLSFLQPGTPNALSPWQWSGEPISQTGAKYFIAPLWGDIAPVAQTTYTTLGTATSQKFSWNNIAEYYSRGGILRLNSFSVEINANGDIATKYFGLNLRTSNISIGLKGDSDYTQIAYYPYGYVLQNQADWTANTKTTAPIAPTVPKQEPIPEPVIVEQSVSDSIQNPVFVQNPVQNPVQSPVQNTTQTSQVASQQESKSEKKSVVKIQQSNDMAVVDAAISVAMTSAQESSVQTSSINLASNPALSLLNKPTAQASQRSEQNDALQNMANLTDRKEVDITLLNSLEVKQPNQEYKEKALNRSVSPNNELGVQLPIFTSFMLPDSQFYAPKEIYKRQRVVDNQRLLKSLNSDKKFMEMIDGQYR